MKMKENHRFFYGAYSNVTPYLSSSKNIKTCQWLSQLKFLSFMTKVNPNNENETKSDIFPMDIFQFGTVSFFIKIY